VVIVPDLPVDVGSPGLYPTRDATGLVSWGRRVLVEECNTGECEDSVNPTTRVEACIECLASPATQNTRRRTFWPVDGIVVVFIVVMIVVSRGRREPARSEKRRRRWYAHGASKGSASERHDIEMDTEVEVFLMKQRVPCRCRPGPLRLAT
jgi:hypothetical protein